MKFTLGMILMAAAAMAQSKPFVGPVQPIEIMPGSAQSSIAIYNTTGKMVLAIRADGTIAVGEGVKPDDAAKQFLEALKTLAPLFARESCQQSATPAK